jgi:hypothetical protein
MSFSIHLCPAKHSAETGPYTCPICKVESMSLDVFQAHVDTQQHKAAYKDLYNLIEKKVERYKKFFCAPLFSKIARLKKVRDLKQKLEIEAGLFRYLTAPASSDECDDDSEAQRAELEPAMKMLDQYEYNERLVVLALAVWRAQCLESLSALSANGQTGWTAVLEYLMQWSQSGWKAHKAEHRNSSAMDIVVRAVLPFLPKEDS